MAERRATCSCGQLQVIATAEPIRVSVCHCLACQRRTGSVFGVQARFAAEDVRIEGESSEYVRISDDGDPRTFHFCPRCGATVYFPLSDSAEFIAVPVGAFADPSFPAPVRSIYESRQHPWVTIAPLGEHHD